MDLLISFDTTGSMMPAIAEVRHRVTWLVTELHKEIPGLNIGIIAHGDYCDKNRTYVTKQLAFTSDPVRVRDFVRGVGRTDGGDLPECYELVLHQARNMGWFSKERVVILIGDDVPHSHHEALRQGGVSLDWREEARALHELVGATIYSVQCLDRPGREYFYKDLADIGGGAKLDLRQFKNIVELILAVVYKQSGGNERLQDYASHLEVEGLMNRGIADFLNQLSGKDREYDLTISSKYTAARADGLVPVHPSRFQILDVNDRTPIRYFVENMGARFAPGRGFYELTKKVLVQERKEVVLVDRITGDMFTGDLARDLLGLPYGERGKVSPKRIVRDGCYYDVFIQSTSYNRVLLPGTRFLYEVEDWED